MAKPEIRLKGFEGEWERHSLEKCLSISNERNTNKKYGREDVLSVSDDFGVVNQIKLLGRSYAGADLSGYKLVRPGQIIYTKSPLRFKPFGIIKENQKEIGIVSVLYAVYNVSDNLNPSFVDLYFAPSYRTNNYLLPLISKGAKNTINISDENALKGTFHFPIVDEQKSITEYFKSLDSMLQSTTKKIESLKQVKQACLVSMFPQAGETTPRVRFKGFEGEWEDVSFKEISYLSGKKNRENLPLESYSISNEYGFIPQQEQFENGGTMAKADKKMYYIVTPDSFAYNPARINVGSIGYDDLDKDVIVSSLYVVFKTDANTHNPFLNYWFKTPMFKKMIELYQEGGVRLYFFYDKLCSCHFRRPSLKEQQRIASYFRSLDKQISLQEKRLEKLKQIKAACLDKMFV
jgi:type I restriction enzyme S subunit